MKQIRKGTFETNSSSTHSICITKEFVNKESLENKDIEINLNNYTFGWEKCKYKTLQDKLAYLLIAITKYKNITKATERIVKLEELLKEMGLAALRIKGLEITMYMSDTYESVYFDLDWGYIDHSDETEYFIDEVLKDKALLERFLLDETSFIWTGNDNDDGDVIREENAKLQEMEKTTHDIYYKGN